MPGPARRRGGDNAGGGGRRWGQGGSGALGPAKAGPAVVEIGSVPRRDRSGSAARSVRRRRARGAGAARWAFRCESDGGVVGLAPKCRPRRERGRAPAGVVPHERRTAPRRAQPAPRGRTRRRTVVPRSTRSYPGSRGRTLKPPYSTTRRRSVRPRAFMYDRATRVRPARGNGHRPRRTYDHTSNGTTARPSHRTRPHPTHHPHTPTTATHPDRKPHSTSVRQPPPTTHHHRPRREPPHRTTTTNEPISSRNSTELEPEPNRTRRRGPRIDGGPPSSVRRATGRRHTNTRGYRMTGIIIRTGVP